VSGNSGKECGDAISFPASGSICQECKHRPLFYSKFDYVDFAAPMRDMVAEYIQKANEFYNEIDEF
jgi:hypothetical protein